MDKCKIVHLHDDGQDFLRWYLNGNGIVVKSEPFQTSIWKGTKVLNHVNLRPGGILHIQCKDIGITTLNYRCEKVEEVTNTEIVLDAEMTAVIKDFIGSVWLMRKSQKEYFRTRDKAIMILAKNYEKEVDEYLNGLAK